MTEAKIIAMPRRRPEGDVLVSATEIAGRWGVHRDTVYRIDPAELPYMKLGPRTRRYRFRDVLEYERRKLIGG